MDSFNDIIKPEFHNKKIHIRCIVTGKGVSVYSIPKKITIHRKNSDKKVTVKPGNEDILKFIDINSSSLHKVIGEVFKLTKFNYTVTEVQNIERIFIVPNTGAERNKMGSLFVGYYIGSGLEINTIYDLDGYTTTYSKNQTVTQVYLKAKKIKSDIENFSLAKKVHTQLEKFCVDTDSVHTIYNHLQELYRYYAHNVTKIYGRFDLHLAIDIACKSVLSFKFGNEVVKKGWSDILIIGDTRCGKGYVTEKLLQYFDIGEVVSGDTCSLAGLIGGLQQLNSNWAITWGKIPLNDCGLLVIDEASELRPEDWSKLSRIRSEGIAEITKIQSQVTNARTRLIFLTNPINKTISNYSYGIQALQDVVKSPEDIARFDYVLVVAHDEVKMTAINKSYDILEGKYSIESERELSLWVWSRKMSDIEFSSKAIKLIYERSIELANIYSFSIPLIQGENVRIKLAKVAIAFAGRLYSNKNNGQCLYVRRVHVNCAFVFFNMIYKKEVSGYYAISQLQRPLVSTSENFKPIEKYFNSYAKTKQNIFKCLLINNNITVNDLCEHLDQALEISREMISQLLRNNCIIKKYTYYIKTPAFTSWLKHRLVK